MKCTCGSNGWNYPCECEWDEEMLEDEPCFDEERDDYQDELAIHRAEYEYEKRINPTN